MMDFDGLVRVDVGLKEHGYPIYIGTDFLTRVGEMMKPFARSSKVFVIMDNLVGALYLPMVKTSLEQAGFTVFDLVVPQGEASKSFDRAKELLERILKTGCDRQSVVVALGGGVVGDLAGFCASLLLRGVDFIQIPTTLLAQTDSSVGGKTAVNTAVGKNLVGTFHQPKAVFIDVSTLKTLDPQQILAGFAEVVKYGLALNADFWNWLVDNGESVLALDDTVLSYAVEQCCRIKTAVVEADEFEETGLRALLNYGHTIGHAIESVSGLRGSILHGEAVAIGSVLAAYLSADLGLCDAGLPDAVAQQYEKWGLPTHFDALKVSELMTAMHRDKKTTGSHLNFVLLEGIGSGVLVHDIEPNAVIKVLNEKGRKKNDFSYY